MHVPPTQPPCQTCASELSAHRETFTLQPPGSLFLRSPIPGGDHLAVRVGALKQAEEAVAPWESHEEENLIKLKLKRQLK